MFSVHLVLGTDAQTEMQNTSHLRCGIHFLNSLPNLLFCPDLALCLLFSGYVFNAEGAAFIAAWGSAPGGRTYGSASAESAIHSEALSVHHWRHAAIAQ